MKPTKETIIRTVALVVAFINQLLTTFGKNPMPYSDEEVYVILTTGVTIATTMWAWWKNNSFTQEALMADEIMREAKSERKRRDDEA